MISKELAHYIDAAGIYAGRYYGPTTSLVHVLLSLVDDKELQVVLHECGVSYLDIRQATIDLIAERVTSKTAPAYSGRERLSALCLHTIQTARQKAAARGSDVAGPLDFVAAMLEVHDDESFDFCARTILANAGVTVSGFSRARGLPIRSFKEPSPDGNIFPSASVNPVTENARWHVEGIQDRQITGNSVPSFCVDMTDMARNGRYDRSFGREQVIASLVTVLGRRKKRNAILVGEPGVGKTSVAEELACLIAEGRAGPKLSDVTLLSLDVGALVGGTKYRGDLEERIKRLIADLSENPSFVLFIDEIHTLVDSSHSASIAADLLKPALASGAIRCIGATTLDEYRRYFESDAAMSRRFTSINIHEPTRDEAVAILERSARPYEEFHGVIFPSWAFEVAVDLSVRFLPERRLPDKALEVLDDVATRATMNTPPTVTREMFLDCLREKAGRTADNATVLANIGNLEPCLAEMARAVLRNTLADDAERPVVAVLADKGIDRKNAVKSVASVLQRPYEWLDMGEFKESNSVSALIGAPPGYVGHDNGGRLYELVRRSPDGILHLHDIELAHPGVIRTIEECLAAGLVRDSAGRVASMGGVQVVVSMTRAPQKSRIGFSAALGEEENTGLDIVDNAETRVVLGQAAIQGRNAAALSRLVAAAKSVGAKLTLAAGLAEHLDDILGQDENSWKRNFGKLVRTPVLDYLVSRNEDFTLEATQDGIAIREY